MASRRSASDATRLDWERIAARQTAATVRHAVNEQTRHAAAARTATNPSPVDTLTTAQHTRAASIANASETRAPNNAGRRRAAFAIADGTAPRRTMSETGRREAAIAGAYFATR